MRSCRRWSILRWGLIGHQTPGVQAPRAGGPAMQAAALGPAGAGVGQFHAARGAVAQRRLGQGDVFAGARAGVGQALIHQPRQGGFVEMAALGLPGGRFVGHQAAIGQLLQDALVGAGHAARGVHVFDAHQPAAALRAHVQPAGQRCHQRPGMQRASGRWGKAADDHGLRQARCRGGGRRLKDSSQRARAARARSSPDTKACSTRLPRHQSPHRPTCSRASHTKGWPSGVSVCAWCHSWACA